MRARLTALALGLGSLLFFLAGIKTPPRTFYDEPLYVDAGRAYLTGAPDPSPYGPPLGKLLVGASMLLLGDSPIGWRMASAFFGALTLVGVFLLATLLLRDYALALSAAAITLLNNFLYVFSRTAMVDIFLLAFAVWGIVAFVSVLKLDGLSVFARRALLALSAVLLGFACACKWNGVDELCVVILVGGLLLLWPRDLDTTELQRCRANLQHAGSLWFFVSFLLLPGIAYFATFLPLCRLLHLPFSIGGLYSQNLYIWRFHRAVPGNAAIISPWYKWPLQVRPQRALSYLVGNWYVMWGGLAALCFCLRRFARALPETLIVLLYSVNLLQWAATPQACNFYYYYFPAALFLGMAIPIALQRLPERVYGVRVSLITVIPAVCVFAYCFGQMAHLPAPYDSLLGGWH